MKTILSSFLILFVFIISSCEGPQGEPGPQGTPGATGSQGPAGQTGPAGKVTFYASEWIKVDNNHWIESYDPTILASSIALFGGNIDKLTQTDLNGGIVLVYDTYFEDKATINALAYDYVFDDNHVWFSYAATKFEETAVKIYATFAKNIEPKNFFTGDTWYRVIIIPALAGGRMKGVDLRDYNAVKTYLGIKD